MFNSVLFDMFLFSAMEQEMFWYVRLRVLNDATERPTPRQRLYSWSGY